MPFLDHLEELRWRIIWALGGLGLGLAAGFVVTLHYHLVAWLAKPILKLLPSHALYYTHPGDAFTLTLDTAFTFGFVVASPLVFYQLWAFLAPALKPNEKRLGLGVLFGGVLLFVAGAALAYFVVVPLALPWLMDFGGPALLPLITAEEYFDFIFAMIISFGVSFELPIVILALATLGLVTPAFLSKYRRHAIVLIVIIGAFITPGDMVWTTIALAVPLYALYELSVLMARIVERRRKRRRAEDDARWETPDGELA